MRGCIMSGFQNTLSKPMGLGVGFGKRRSWVVHVFDGNQTSEALPSKAMTVAMLPTLEAIICSIASDIRSVFLDHFQEAGFWDAKAKGKLVVPLGGDIPSSTPN